MTTEEMTTWVRTKGDTYPETVYLKEKDLDGNITPTDLTGKSVKSYFTDPDNQSEIVLTATILDATNGKVEFSFDGSEAADLISNVNMWTYQIKVIGTYIKTYVTSKFLIEP
jgi:hypothetical protein